MSPRWKSHEGPRGDEYDVRWEGLEAEGIDPHGEASFVLSFTPATVLDAGCGTGRVAIELARHGADCVGFDIDPAMLDAARRKAPRLRWIEGDAAQIDVRDTGPGFDVVLLAGNVMIFLEPGTEDRVLANMAAHLAPGGVLVSGFSLVAGGYDLADLDRDATAAGLDLIDRFATWDRERWSSAADYAVSVFSAGE